MVKILQTKNKICRLCKEVYSDEKAINTTFFIFVLSLLGIIVAWVAMGPLFDSLYILITGMTPDMIDPEAKADALKMYYWFGMFPLFVFIALLYFVIKRSVDVSKGFSEEHGGNL